MGLHASARRFNSLKPKELGGGPGQNRTADTLIFSQFREIPLTSTGVHGCTFSGTWLKGEIPWTSTHGR